ncbi:MAG: signal peptidase [Planctomycetaceae bacterium]|jgi:cell fate regulator YaaT (PSP1 superfamily)|nr:signal peptidase [Planctomycetaceae bacterium]
MSTYIIRYGSMRFLGEFTAHESIPELHHGTSVIVRTSRGQEVGKVLCEATEEACKRIPEEHERGRIVRLMSRSDEVEQKRIREGERGEFGRCEAIIKRMELNMGLVRVEHIFGGERIIVYYVADGRIDFRELVKVLGNEFKTRIEMRQIGVRDETKLLAEYGDCGREVCCNNCLTEMPPVSMKMAKLQKATLDPTKISGRCGRLKCCFRYENEVYVELQNNLPQIGKQVATPQGEGKVIGHDILQQKVVIDINEIGRKTYSVSDVAAGNEVLR